MQPQGSIIPAAQINPPKLPSEPVHACISDVGAAVKSAIRRKVKLPSRLRTLLAGFASGENLRPGATNEGRLCRRRERPDAVF